MSQLLVNNFKNFSFLDCYWNGSVVWCVYHKVGSDAGGGGGWILGGFIYFMHGLIFKSKLKTQPSVGGIKIHENQFS